MTRLIVRLTHLVDDCDHEVVLLLKKLRHTLKSAYDITEIDRFSDELARHMILRSEASVKSRADAAPAAVKDLVAAIRSLQVDKGLRAKLDGLADRLAGAQDIEQQLCYLREIFSLLSSSLPKLESKDASRGGVKGWFEKKPSKPDPAVDEFLSKTVVLLQRIFSLIDVLNGNGKETHWLRDQLKDSQSFESVSVVLEDVIELLADMSAKVNEERMTTQSFLGGLRDKLQTVEEAIFSVISDGDDSFKRAAQLESEVSNDVRVIGKAVEEDDLLMLKKTVEMGLSNLTAKVAGYLEEEQRHHQESKTKIQDLSLQVRNMEAETNKLRSEVRMKQDLAVKDPLTGVYNRAGYEERIKEEFSRRQRTGAPLSMVFVDCNKFKQINDTFGHNAGDVVLVKVAEVLKSRARVSDIVARYGGDEFVVLLPDTAIDGAEIFAHDACAKVKQAGFNNNGRPLDVSISCGVTEVRSDDDPASVLHRADHAMYTAKKECDTKVFSVR
ncbi:MAG: GGDEF domain-containing protein [Porticoccaceae bacterium]